MREFDESGLRLSKYQGELFEQSLIKTQCSSPIFLRRFMYSQTAARMDKEGFLFEAFSVSDAIEEIENEYGKSKYGKISGCFVHGQIRFLFGLFWVACILEICRYPFCYGVLWCTV